MAKIFLFSIALLNISIPSWAGPSELLKHRHRPRVEEILRELHPWPKRNPFTGHRMQNLEALKNAILSVGPKAIAGLERTYPGGTWAPLGRDAAFFGDMLDAFYISMGQTGRVSRLNGSSGTIRGVDPAQLAKFLESAGLKMGSGSRASDQPPFIIIDNTGYGDTSQSKQLIAAAFKEHQNRGGKPEDLVRKVNAVNFSGTEENGLSSTKTDIKKFFRRQANEVKRQGLPQNILGLDLSKGGAGSLTYTTEYHGPFGHLHKRRNGKFEGSAANGGDRTTALAEIYTMINIVYSDEFKQRVFKECRRLGFEFPRRVPNQEEIKKITARDAQKIFAIAHAAIIKKRKELGKVGEQKRGRMSDNGVALYNEVTDHIQEGTLGKAAGMTNSILLSGLSEAVSAFDAGSIGRRDLRRIVGGLLGYADIDHAFGRDLMKIGSVIVLLQNESKFFSDNKRNDEHIHSVRNFNKLFKMLALKCSKALKEEDEE